MKLLFGLLVVLLTDTTPTRGQISRPVEHWTGTWILDVGRTTFGTILFPGTPRDLEIIGQELQIEMAESKIRLSGHTTVQIAGKTLTSKDDTSLRLDGTETKVGPAVLVLRPIDAYTFEIVSTLKQSEREYRQVSRFVFSRDGRSLTETKLQTERALAAGATAESGDQILRSSTSTLLFSRKS
jgi:hypothetical protein